MGISIKARPVDGEANKAIIKYLSDIFNLSKSDVCIQKGGTSKHKILSINYDISNEDAYNILKNNII